MIGGVKKRSESHRPFLGAMVHRASGEEALQLHTSSRPADLWILSELVEFVEFTASAHRPSLLSCLSVWE